MEILFNNPIGAMYGPYFLVFYGFVIAFAVIVLAIVKNSFDKSDKMPVPSVPAEIDPYEIAYLRGGTNEVVRSVIFSLLQKGYIEIDNSGPQPEVRKVQNPASQASLNQIEQMALGWIGQSRQAKEFFGSSGLNKQLEVYGTSYKGRFSQQQMLVGDELKRVFLPIKWAVLLGIAGLGAYKILAAIMFGKYNIIFLVVFGVIGLLIAWKVGKFPRLTKLGTAYLQKLQDAFDTFKYQAQRTYLSSNAPQNAPQTTFGGVDPLLLSVGIFGSAILAGTVFDSYNSTFQKAQQNNAAAGGACGSECGSSCSGGSSCSSGDSGGSSCGGGCGGCGGGD